MDLPKKIDNVWMERQIRLNKYYEKDKLDDLTLEAAAKAMDDYLIGIRASVDFVEKTLQEQRIQITQMQDKINAMEKEVIFYKRIISYFVDR